VIGYSQTVDKKSHTDSTILIAYVIDNIILLLKSPKKYAMY